MRQRRKSGYSSGWKTARRIQLPLDWNIAAFFEALRDLRAQNSGTM
ncbi:MAG: hypothetical protein ACLUKN_01685 [Bacilli bacterium]